MTAYWFDVFTLPTWEEARASGFGVSGFSESKWSMVQKVQIGDELICYIKGRKSLIGILRVVGTPFFAREPRIWADHDFPARLPIEAVLLLDDDTSLDLQPLLPSLSFFRAGNLRSTWAYIQGSPTRLAQADGELLASALREHAISAPATPPEAEPAVKTAEPVQAAVPQPSIPPVLSLVRADPLQELADEITTAQRDATHPARLERAVAAAFAFLGFDVTHRGKPGQTDILVSSSLGQERFKAVVDTKASTAGRVPDNQITWPAIKAHRKAEQADYAAVVCEQFAGGNLIRYATDDEVSLIETAELIEVVRLHAAAPFPIGDLRNLLATVGRTASVVADLRQKSDVTLRHWRLLGQILALLDAFSRTAPSVVPTAGNLHAVFVSQAFGRSGHEFSPPSEQDVREALIFLASRAVGILRPVDPDSSAYRLAMTADTARRRLQALSTGVVKEAGSASSDEASRSLGL